MPLFVVAVLLIVAWLLCMAAVLHLRQKHIKPDPLVHIIREPLLSNGAAQLSMEINAEAELRRQFEESTRETTNAAIVGAFRSHPMTSDVNEEYDAASHHGRIVAEEIDRRFLEAVSEQNARSSIYTGLETIDEALQRRGQPTNLSDVERNQFLEARRRRVDGQAGQSLSPAANEVVREVNNMLAGMRITDRPIAMNQTTSNRWLLTDELKKEIVDALMKEIELKNQAQKNDQSGVERQIEV